MSQRKVRMGEEIERRRKRNRGMGWGRMYGKERTDVYESGLEEMKVWRG